MTYTNSGETSSRVDFSHRPWSTSPENGVLYKKRSLEYKKGKAKLKLQSNIYHSNNCGYTYNVT